MSNLSEVPGETTDERLFSWRRIRIALLGSFGVIVLGIILVCIYTYSQYGGTPFDDLLGRKREQSPDIGKLAYTRGTDFFIGIIRGEGLNTRRVRVYYIEQAGGQMIEVARERVEVREPARPSGGDR